MKCKGKKDHNWKLHNLELCQSLSVWNHSTCVIIVEGYTSDIVHSLPLLMYHSLCWWILSCLSYFIFPILAVTYQFDTFRNPSKKTLDFPFISCIRIVPYIFLEKKRDNYPVN